MAIAKWTKIDFHTHTPESRCFENRDSVQPRQWIEAVKASGLNAVVVTDHNSVGWISKLREVTKKEDKLFIFPGVELCVGTSFTHFILIFDPEMSNDDIEGFLIECGISKSDWGNTEKSVSEDKLQEMIQKNRKKVLVIPAHFNSNKGICKTVGQNGIKAFYNKFQFDAIEVRNENDNNEFKNKVTNKVIPPLAKVTGSDNPGSDTGVHGLINFGKVYTWVKMSEYSLEALRQVFLDSKDRSKCVLENDEGKEDPNYIEHNYISGLAVKNLKHVDRLDFRFSPNLNCIIGGRGCGKSTIIEMLRLGLREFDDSKSCPKLFDTYKDESIVDVYYDIGSSNPYCVHVKGKKNNKTFEVEGENGIVEECPAFPVSIYSQKELFNIVEDENNPEKNDISPLIKIIDENIMSIKNKKEEEKEIIKKDIMTLVEELMLMKSQIKDIPRIKAEIELDTSKLAKVKDVGVLEKREELNNLNSAFTNIKSHVEEYCKILELTYKNFKDKTSQTIKQINEEIKHDNVNKEDKEVITKIEKLHDSILENFDNNNNQAKEIVKELTSLNLFNKLKSVEKEYNDLLSKVQGIDIENIKKIESDIADKSTKLKTLREIEFKVESKITEIETKVTEYIKIHKEITQERNNVIKDINSKASNIKLSIHTLSHGDRWLYNLRKALGKENSFDSDFITLKNKLFEDGILVEKSFHEWLRFILITENPNIKDFLSVETLNDSRFENIWTDKKKQRSLHSLMNIIPEDRIEIKIVNDGQTLNINEGSPGQKTASILAFILNQGKQPLIIDQPEDDLDNSLIIDLIVENIRNLKNHRQIIIATHNPNIPVLGDAEGIIMLERDVNGKVVFKQGKKTGCIEEKTIKKGLCDIMEGGIQAFKRRENKYKYVEV